MSLRNVAVLLRKELVNGPKNFIFIFALVVPVVLTLLVTLLFGELFAGKPRLGLVDEGDSRLVAMARAVDAVALAEFDTAGALQDAVADGNVDLGLVLPPGFDQLVRQSGTVEATAYAWGGSLLKDRTVLATTLVVLMRELAGQEPPIEIVPVTLGEGEAVPWEERLLPFLVLMTIVMAGSMVPATSLVEEKQKRTLKALTVTPISLNEVLAAKGLLGVLLSLVMGVVILLINQAFGTHPFLLVLILALGAAMASVFGVLLGALVSDINTLFATIKGVGIFLYAPALVYLFPEIPQWIGQIFPTYYMIQPVVEVVQRGGTWADVAPELAVLAGMTVVLMGVVALLPGRVQQQET